MADTTAPTTAPLAHGMPPVRRLLWLVRPDRGELLAVVAFAVAVGVLLLATPVAVQTVVNFVAMGGVIPPLVAVALLLFLGLAAAALLSAVQAWTVELLQRRVFVRLVADLAGRLPRAAAGSYGSGYGPELVNRFFDIVQVQKLGSYLLLDGLSILLSVLVGLVVLAFYHPLLLAFGIVLLAVILAIVLGPMRRGTRTAIAESAAKYATEAWFEEVVASPHLFKSAGAVEWVRDEADRRTRAWIGARQAHFRVVFSQTVAALGLQVLASTALIGIGGFLVISGTLTLGQLVAAELIVTLVVSSVAKVGKHLESWYDLLAATDKVGHLLDVPMEEQGGEDYQPPAGGRGVALQLLDVGWRRPDGHFLFSGLTLSVPAGGRLGVSGPSGAGKSLLAELIWGLHAPATGSIQVDGRDLRSLRRDALRRFASLSGRMEFVQGTVFENVRLGRAAVSADDVREALRRVGLLAPLSLLPRGLETPLRHDGSPLSGGQLRRLLIARAIANRPRLLLIQDFLDQFPADGRRELLDVIFAREAPWTLVVITNSEDVLARCSQVLRLPGDPVDEPAAEGRAP